MLSEVSQVGKDRCHVISLVWDLKTEANLHIQTDRWLPERGEVGRWVEGVKCMVIARN